VAKPDVPVKPPPTRWPVAMSEVTTFNWTIDEDLAGYARHGFSGIEIWLNKAARNGAPYDKLPAGEVPLSAVQELTDALVGTGLQAVSVVCGGALTEPDDERWRSRVEHLRFAIGFAGAIGAQCLLVVPGDLNGLSRPEAVERTSQALHEALPHAHRHGVDLAIEPLRPVHTDFVNTIPQALEIVERLDDPRCGVCIDTYQVWRGETERASVIAEIGAAARWARIVQVADSGPVPRSKEDRFVPAEGVLPLPEMLAPLFAGGYRGWLAVEIMSRELWAGDYDELLERCQTGMAAVTARTEQLLALPPGETGEVAKA
jgi:sugar phosphate isomerase/epimerase